MNPAHAHLLVNHIPIIGLFFGVLILLSGFLMRSTITRRVAIFILLISGIGAVIADKTGENAEHHLGDSIQTPKLCLEKCACSPEKQQESKEKLHHLIHEHEEKAEKFMPFMFGVVVLSLLALFFEWKKKRIGSIFSVLLLVLSLLSLYLAKEVGNSGGEIMHPEIRK